MPTPKATLCQTKPRFLPIPKTTVMPMLIMTASATKSPPTATDFEMTAHTMAVKMPIVMGFMIHKPPAITKKPTTPTQAKKKTAKTPKLASPAPPLGPRLMLVWPIYKAK